MKNKEKKKGRGKRSVKNKKKKILQIKKVVMMKFQINNLKPKNGKSEKLHRQKRFR